MRALPFLLLPCLLGAAPPDLVMVPADALRCPGGLAYRTLQPGKGGVSPQGDDIVIVHFSGWDASGKAFANTRAGDFPRSVALGRLMPGMQEALRAMTPGESRRLWLPEPLAFAGAAGKPKGPLVLDLELLDIHPHPSHAPLDLAAPGIDAVKKKGLFSKVLRPGTGTAHPRASDWVTVHYSGWTMDGKSFDSSLLRGAPEVFQLKAMIEGWIEGIPLMVAGERRRFWIPQGMAYGGAVGKPAGTLVFDVELIDFRR